METKAITMGSRGIYQSTLPCLFALQCRQITCLNHRIYETTSSDHTPNLQDHVAQLPGHMTTLHSHIGYSPGHTTISTVNTTNQQDHVAHSLGHVSIDNTGFSYKYWYETIGTVGEYEPVKVMEECARASPQE
ncbi:hypothetical protein J6590_013978 [Homalodisca vitripennis]|nr:hypothetical protein J6590_013978 [Homalodisca vitripennis]